VFLSVAKQVLLISIVAIGIYKSLHCRYKAVGIRLDSGDLAYLSVETRKFFHAIEEDFGVVGFGKMSITASNDLNEETIDALNKQVIYVVPIQNGW